MSLLFFSFAVVSFRPSSLLIRADGTSGDSKDVCFGDRRMADSSRVCVFVCLCVCVWRDRERERDVYIYIYIYIYIERERERERERDIISIYNYIY